VSVIIAPKLETLGCLDDELDSSRLVFGTTVLQGFLVVSLTTVVRSVKILALKSLYIKLDTIIDLMKCFPCLEKLYIKVSFTVLEFIPVLFIGLLLDMPILVPAMWFEFPHFNLSAL